MRIAICILAAVIMVAPVPAFAQDWINYFDTEQRFSVNLPGAPVGRRPSTIALLAARK